MLFMVYVTPCRSGAPCQFFQILSESHSKNVAGGADWKLYEMIFRADKLDTRHQLGKAGR